MFLSFLTRLGTLAFVALALTSCGAGTAGPTPASVQVNAADRTTLGAGVSPARVALERGRATYALGLPAGYSGSISLHAVGDAAQVRVSTDPVELCPSVPLLTLTNPSAVPIELEVVDFRIETPCKVEGALFGVSFYQREPMPTVQTSRKLGDITVRGDTLRFVRGDVSRITLAPHTTSVIATVNEESSAEVAFPVAPGATTMLTSNAPLTVPPVAFKYSSASGGSLYSAACFNAFDALGKLAKDLVGVPILGTPKAYCLIDPKNTPALTFAGSPQFSLAFLKNDAGLLELDGPVITNPCMPVGSPTPTSENCPTTAFTVGASPTLYQRAIFSNTKDIAACVPSTPNTDCNDGAIRETTVEPNRAVQLLVANDATYKLPFFGGYELVIPTGSACTINTGPDNSGAFPDFPRGYYDPAAVNTPRTSTPTDAFFPGSLTGGSAEFDLISGRTGQCAVTIVESTGLRRTFEFSIPIH